MSERDATGRGRHRRRDADHRRATVAVGYLRRSTDRQEQSIPDQQRAIEVYCAEMGLRLSRFYTDDAISGTSSVNRKGFQDMMEAAQSDSCDFGIIVVYDVKRFGRVDNDEAGYYRHLLRQQGVEVRYASEGFTGDATDDLMRPVKQWQARQESKDLSKVSIRGLLTKSTTGHWMGGAPPFGYDLKYLSQSGQFLCVLRYNPDGSKTMFDENGNVARRLERGESVAVSKRDHCTLVPSEGSRVQIVQRIFRLYAEERRGFGSIADLFNKEQVVPARGPAWAAHYSGKWAMTTVRGIIVNPAYCGDMVWNRRTDARFYKIVQGRPVERKEICARRMESNAQRDWLVVRDAHPPLVSRRVWQMAQMALEEKTESESQRGINPRSGESAALSGEAHDRRGAHGSCSSVRDSGPRSKFLLSGLVVCAKCGSRYEGITQPTWRKRSTGARTKKLYYACGGYIRRGKSVCSLGQVSMEALDDAVARAALKYYRRFTLANGDKALEAAVREATGLEDGDLRHRRAELDQERERIAGVERRLVDNITPSNRDAVDRRLLELVARRDKVQQDSEKLESMRLSGVELKRLVVEARDFVLNVNDLLLAGPVSSRRMAIRRCVEAVEFDRDKRAASVKVKVVPLVLVKGVQVAKVAVVLKRAP